MFIVMYGRAEGYYFQTASFLARRSLIEQVGGFEDAFRSHHEDTVFHIKLFLDASITSVSDSCWVWYRQHTNSATRYTPRSLLYRLRENVRFTSWMSHYVSEQGVQDPEILDIVHHMHAQNRTAVPFRQCQPARSRRVARSLPASYTCQTYQRAAPIDCESRVTPWQRGTRQRDGRCAVHTLAQARTSNSSRSVLRATVPRARR